MNENPYMMLAKVILPSEMTEYFDLVKVCTDEYGGEPRIHLYLDEKDKAPDDRTDLSPNGFYEESCMNDFPIREYRTVLHVRRRRWKHREHAQKWLVFPKNIGPNLSIDETALSNGDLYTIVSNKDAHGRKGALVAIVSGTKVEVDALNSLVYARTDLIKITSVLSQKTDEGASFSSPPALACQHHYAFHLFTCVHCMRWKRSVLRKLLAL